MYIFSTLGCFYCNGFHGYIAVQLHKLVAKVHFVIHVFVPPRKHIREKLLMPLSFYFLARQQDVRATEIDKVDMYQSYRPGDIVRAMVVSFRQKYLLTLHSSTNCSFFSLFFH
jgi:thioredoxin-related protein